jgi:ADP-heptose:LPS heptosyltransferase
VSTLVIHPGALGDVLLAVPALRAIRQCPWGARLVLAGQPRIGALLTALGVTEAWRDFEGLGLGALFVEDAEPAPMQPLAAAARVVCWFGSGDPTFVRRLGTTAPGAIVASPAGDGTRPVWRHLLASVGAGDGAWCGPLAVPAALVAEGRRALAAAGWDGRAPLVLVHAGAGGLAKRWPVDGFARVLAALAAERRLACAILEGPADGGTAEALAARLDAPLMVLRDLPLPGLAGALRSVTAWVGNDSGASHLAAAVGVPALVLFERSKLCWQPWSATARPLAVRVAELAAADVAAVRAGLAELV